MKKLILLTMLLIGITSPSFAQTLPGADTRTKNVSRDFPNFITTKVNSISESTTREDLKELVIESHLDRLAGAYAGSTYIKKNDVQTKMISALFEEPYNEIKEDLFDFSHRVDGFYFISVQHRLKAFVK